MTNLKIWCLLIDREKKAVLGDVFDVEVHNGAYISDLKKKVKEERPVALEHVDAAMLTVWRCTDSEFTLANIDPDDFNDRLNEVFSRDKENVKKLNSTQGVEQFKGKILFIEVPGASRLFLSTMWDSDSKCGCHKQPAGKSRTSSPFCRGENCLSLTEISLSVSRGDELVLSKIKKYESFFIKVTKWGSFEGVDLPLNGITRSTHADGDLSIEFVKTFQKTLDGSVRLPDGRAVERAKCMMGSAWAFYFDGSEIAHNSEQSGAVRSATTHEEAHVYTMADPIWGNRPLSFSMSEATAFSLFYSLFPTENIQPVQYLRSCDPWPFPLVTFFDGSNTGKYRKYTPKSDYLLMKSGSPRYLVEVQSGDHKAEWPEDLVGMLLQGSSIVRFANMMLDASEKKFVLVCTYFWRDWHVSRYLLFQTQNETKVYFREAKFNLRDKKERLVHGREVYNLLQLLRTEKEIPSVGGVIGSFETAVKDAHLKSFRSRGTKRRYEDDEGEGGGANDSEEFKAHGYELQPEPGVIVDDRGCVWEPLFQLPPNIRIVHRLARAGEELIAKKVRAHSDEMAILKLLNNSHPKSEHVISLLDSFRTRSGQWIILPKLETVNLYLTMEPDRIRGKVAAVCWGLIKGLAHLHGLCIAHRDIKPDNVVLDANAGYCAKIIDFEFAMQMKDENEEVDDVCGAATWMAPEVEKTSGPYSPIKADRWACGRFLLHVLDELQEEDVVLKAVGSMLKVDDPRQRPSMLEWQNWTSSLLIDDMPNGKAASHVVKVIPQVRPRVAEYGESGDVKRHRDPGIRQFRVH
ncbi:hypothetical protein ACEPAF_1142 [Sanghuangporus sanghuang]